MHCHIRRNECSGEFGVCGCSSTAASDGICDIMNLQSRIQHPLVCAEGGLRTFSQFLSATIGPSVARVSAPRTIPSLKRHPTIVVPVLVALASWIPLFWRKLFLTILHSAPRSCERFRIHTSLGLRSRSPEGDRLKVVPLGLSDSWVFVKSCANIEHYASSTVAVGTWT